MIWYHHGEIHRAILEFAKYIKISILCIVMPLLIVWCPFRLMEKHDGKYLANVLALCVKHYGLEDFVSELKFHISVMADCIMVDSHSVYGQCW